MSEGVAKIINERSKPSSKCKKDIGRLTVGDAKIQLTTFTKHTDSPIVVTFTKSEEVTN